ncbi:MAG: mevalonate kinase [Thermoplasmata archaeon]
MSEDAIAAKSWPLAARAPGKCILFGEHAIVYGKPELVLAIDLYAQMGIREASSLSLNGDRRPLEHNPYLRAGVDHFGAAAIPLELRVTSRIPRAAGLGSSAAFCANLATAFSAAAGGCSRAELHQRSFLIERSAQGVGSPGDTAAAVAGGYLALNDSAGAPLWEITDGDRQWDVHRIGDPGWIWVVAYSGVPRNTADAVRRVAERLAAPDGPRLLDELEEVAHEGISAVEHEDRARVGALLTRNQGILRQLGVSHPRLEALIDALGPATEGVKLTGAGAGGSVVGLPKVGREQECVRSVAHAGGLAFIVRPAREGAQLIGAPS